ncbi:MAG: DUF1456 family protein [Pseudomonadales bacterium]|nr:DUF1456 family protein [Pseudomonadales bacterium]
MTANEILQRLRLILDLSDTQMIATFAEGQQQVTKTQVSAWLQKDDAPDYQLCGDKLFASFLNGLIIQKRGKQDRQQPPTEEEINNNAVFRKLKIAFNLQADDILGLLSSAGQQISKHELSAFFRRPGHKHYRECKDQVLIDFLTGLHKHG